MKELDNVMQKASGKEDDVIAMGLSKGIISEEQANALRALSSM